MPRPPPRSSRRSARPSPRSDLSKLDPRENAASNGARLGDLRADMDRDADRLDTGQMPRAAERVARMGEIDAELVLAVAGRNLGVGFGVDIGIDADRNARGVAHSRRDVAQQRQFRRRIRH